LIAVSRLVIKPWSMSMSLQTNSTLEGVLQSGLDDDLLEILMSLLSKISLLAQGDSGIFLCSCLGGNLTP
jgi:hypothetical protein